MIGVYHETIENIGINGRLVRSCCNADKLLLRPRSMLPTAMQTSMLP